MRKFQITVSTFGHKVTYRATSDSSMDAYMAALDANDHAPCGITVTPA